MEMPQEEVQAYLAFTLGALDSSILDSDECRDFLNMLGIVKAGLQQRLADLAEETKPTVSV